MKNTVLGRSQAENYLVIRKGINDPLSYKIISYFSFKNKFS